MAFPAMAASPSQQSGMNLNPAIPLTRTRPVAATSCALTVGRVLVVAGLLAISPLALVAQGWQYFDTGGSAIEKFHPATLLAALLMLVRAVAERGNPVSGLIDIAERHAGLLPYLAANLFMIVYAAVILRLPVTIFIETYIGAALVAVVFADLEEREARWLARLIHLLLFTNAVLAFTEQWQGFHLTPLVVNGEVLADEPRSTALLGHPLANAILVASYVVILALGGGRDLPVGLRTGAFVVALASLVPFGGRAASAATLVALGLLGLGRLSRVLRGATFDPRMVIAGVIVVPLAALALAAAYDMGAFDTLLNRLFDDEGSAGTRAAMFELFGELSAYDLAFGPDPAVLTTAVRLRGLEYGIESFLVAFVLNYGLVCTAVFVPPLILFFAELAGRARGRAGLAVVTFLVVAATSISLSSKSPTLSIFVLLMVVLLRPDGRAPSGEFGEQAA